MVVIIDYGMGNLRSIQSKMNRLNVQATISNSPEIILAAERLILPGVGFFSTGMDNLRKSDLIPVLEEAVFRKKKPILGICLGMQLFTESSEEGVGTDRVPGLGWISGSTKRFTRESKLRVPHVGWNNVLPSQNSILFRDIVPQTRFYFTHSFYVSCSEKQDIAATTDYGVSFVSAVQKENIYGTQFHPEKSHQFGLQIIENFLRYS